MVSAAVALVAGAKKPLIIAGHGNLLSDSWQELRNFVKNENNVSFDIMP